MWPRVATLNVSLLGGCSSPDRCDGPLTIGGPMSAFNIAGGFRPVSGRGDIESTPRQEA
jgi:hypothetical protein